MKPRKTSSALHEAAHAVVAWRMGYEVAGVYLTDSGGYTKSALGTDPLPQSIIAMAGNAAEMEWHETPPELVSAVDHYTVLSYGFTGRSLPTILALARGAVVEHESDIDRVADELRCRDLGHDDLERLLGELEPADDVPSGRAAWLLWGWVVARRRVVALFAGGDE